MVAVPCCGMPPLSTYIGANVRKARVRLGLSQAQLAEKAGVNGRHLQRIERGLVDLHVSALQALADALEVTPAALLKPAKLEPSRPGRPKLRTPAQRTKQTR